MNYLYASDLKSPLGSGEPDGEMAKGRNWDLTVILSHRFKR
jgi:hypothetical protein